MSGYSYLDEAVQLQIRHNVRKVLREVSLVDPPVCYDTLYSREKISQTYFDTMNPDFVLLEKKIGPDEAAKLRGVLFVNEKRVIVQNDTYEKRRNFPLAHELGHWHLEWHREILYTCSQFDLSPKARKEMEREANYFASELGFMGPRFYKELRDSVLSMDHVLSLSDTFQMSVEATLRRVAEIEDRPCAFLSLKNIGGSAANSLEIRYAVYSDSFIKSYGELDHRQTFKPDSQFAIIQTDPVKRALNRHKFTSLLGESKKRLKTEVWQNPYNIFVLCQPAED